MKKIYKIVIVAFFILIGFNTFNAKAQRPIHEIHTLLIFNFIKYVEWPDDTKNGEFVIAVYGDEDVYTQLKNFYSNRNVKGQVAKIVSVSDLSTINDAHVLYVSAGKSRDFDDILSKFNAKPTLIITDKNGLGKKGSLINFREIAGKLKFEINKASFDSHGLKISTQLLNMGIEI